MLRRRVRSRFFGGRGGGRDGRECSWLGHRLVEIEERAGEVEPGGEFGIIAVCGFVEDVGILEEGLGGFGVGGEVVLEWTDTEKVFDPLEVYGDAPNPTKL